MLGVLVIRPVGQYGKPEKRKPCTEAAGPVARCSRETRFHVMPTSAVGMLCAGNRYLYGWWIAADIA